MEAYSTHYKPRAREECRSEPLPAIKLLISVGHETDPVCSLSGRVDSPDRQHGANMT